MAIRRHRKRSSSRKLRRLIFIGLGLFIGSYAFWMTNKLLDTNETRRGELQDMIALDEAEGQHRVGASIGISAGIAASNGGVQGGEQQQAGGAGEEPVDPEEEEEVEEDGGDAEDAAEQEEDDKTTAAEEAAEQEEDGKSTAAEVDTLDTSVSDEDAGEADADGGDGEGSTPPVERGPPPKGLYDFEVLDIDGELHDMSAHRGKVSLVVNVASNCGYTKPNYDALQPLYQKYQQRGFEIFAFPCNEFGQQEPGENSEIASFARGSYGAKYFLASKVEVNGDNAHPVFKFLKYYLPPGSAGLGEELKWNFEKFLVNKHGFPVKKYGSTWDAAAIEADIDMLLQG